MPDSKKDSQRIRQTYNLTQGHREPAKKASVRLCAQAMCSAAVCPTLDYEAFIGDPCDEG